MHVKRLLITLNQIPLYLNGIVVNQVAWFQIMRNLAINKNCVTVKLRQTERVFLSQKMEGEMEQEHSFILREIQWECGRV